MREERERDVIGIPQAWHSIERCRRESFAHELFSLRPRERSELGSESLSRCGIETVELRCPASRGRRTRIANARRPVAMRQLGVLSILAHPASKRVHFTRDPGATELRWQNDLGKRAQHRRRGGLRPERGDRLDVRATHDGGDGNCPSMGGPDDSCMPRGLYCQ